MSRIRDVICKQQQALAEQRNYDQQNYKAAPSEVDDNESSSYIDKLEGSGGFAGADAKKRRGKAAPPGRCHSCNRAETPEWRRGPDGARTLCNACGLRMSPARHSKCLILTIFRLRKTDAEDGAQGLCLNWLIKSATEGVEPSLSLSWPVIILNFMIVFGCHFIQRSKSPTNPLRSVCSEKRGRLSDQSTFSSAIYPS